MLKWLRKDRSPHRTAIAMIGVKSGDRLAIVGGREPDLAAELALVTGLNGQTTVVDDDASTAARVEAAAARAGSLVEFSQGNATALPFDSETQDVAVSLLALAALDESERTAAVREMLRVLRPGGRVIVIEGARRAGLFAGQAAARLESDRVLAVLQTAGARASRLLADTDGVSYFEGRGTGLFSTDRP